MAKNVPRTVKCGNATLIIDDSRAVDAEEVKQILDRLSEIYTKAYIDKIIKDKEQRLDANI